MTRGPILLAAGGTGGHVFPAEALAAELMKRGHDVGFVTDTRGTGFGKGLDGVQVHRIPAGTPTGKRLTGKFLAGVEIARGTLAAFLLLRRLRPCAAVGFGGYPALPLMLAATQSRLPSVIHEQNAVLGRVNRLLAKRADVIALSFEATRLVPHAARLAITGNPLRPAILAAADKAYVAPTDEIRLLVLGGSQGARIFSDVVPAALVALPDALRARLRVTQQCRPEDLERVRDAYAQAGIKAETASFYADVAARLAATHLVVSRSGASSTAEIAAIGRPALLVPYAHATDDHQTANAEALVRVGAAQRVAQGDFTIARAQQELSALLGNPAGLITMAAAAKSLGRPDATIALADLVERVVQASQGAAKAPGDVKVGSDSVLRRSVA